MKQFITIFTVNFKCLWREPVSVIVLVAFPILLILILGNALSTYISPDTEIDPTLVAVVTDDENSAFSQFLLSDEISGFFKAKFTDAENAETLFNDGETNIIIYENNGEISVTKNFYDNMYDGIVLSIVDSYKQTGAAASIRMADGGDFEIGEHQVKVTEQSLNKKATSATDYYAVTMLVMILLYTGMNSIELFKKGMLSETGSRIRTAPVSKPVLIGGLVAASTVTSYLQAMVTFVFSAVFYGVNWGERIPLVLVTLFAVCLFSQSFAIFLFMLFKNPGAAIGAMQTIIWTSTFVSKGYVKASFGAADKFFAYAPNALAHNVIFGAIYGGNESKMMFDLFLLFALGLILFIFAFLLGRRKLS